MLEKLAIRFSQQRDEEGEKQLSVKATTSIFKLLSAASPLVLQFYSIPITRQLPLLATQVKRIIQFISKNGRQFSVILPHQKRGKQPTRFQPIRMPSDRPRNVSDRMAVQPFVAENIAKREVNESDRPNKTSEDKETNFFESDDKGFGHGREYPAEKLINNDASDPFYVGVIAVPIAKMQYESKFLFETVNKLVISSMIGPAFVLGRPRPRIDNDDNRNDEFTASKKSLQDDTTGIADNKYLSRTEEERGPYHMMNGSTRVAASDNEQKTSPAKLVAAPLLPLILSIVPAGLALNFGRFVFPTNRRIASQEQSLPIGAEINRSNVQNYLRQEPPRSQTEARAQSPIVSDSPKTETMKISYELDENHHKRRGNTSQTLSDAKSSLNLGEPTGSSTSNSPTYPRNVYSALRTLASLSIWVAAATALEKKRGSHLAPKIGENGAVDARSTNSSSYLDVLPKDRVAHANSSDEYKDSINQYYLDKHEKSYVSGQAFAHSSDPRNELESARTPRIFHPPKSMFSFGSIVSLSITKFIHSAYLRANPVRPVSARMTSFAGSNDASSHKLAIFDGHQDGGKIAEADKSDSTLFPITSAMSNKFSFSSISSSASQHVPSLSQDNVNGNPNDSTSHKLPMQPVNEINPESAILDNKKSSQETGAFDLNSLPIRYDRHEVPESPLGNLKEKGTAIVSSLSSFVIVANAIPAHLLASGLLKKNSVASSRELSNKSIVDSQIPAHPGSLVTRNSRNESHSPYAIQESEVGSLSPALLSSSFQMSRKNSPLYDLNSVANLNMSSHEKSLDRTNSLAPTNKQDLIGGTVISNNVWNGPGLRAQNPSLVAPFSSRLTQSLEQGLVPGSPNTSSKLYPNFLKPFDSKSLNESSNWPIDESLGDDNDANVLSSTGGKIAENNKELRELRRKIKLILDEELRRHGFWG